MTRTPQWYQRYRPVPAPAARVVCFPHAGGGASFFRPWAGDLPPAVELLAAQYPGREDRFGEPVAVDLERLADRFAEALGPERDVPIVLFGHSLGAAVAYEVARRLETTGGAPAALLVVSGRQAPHDPSRLVHRMTDDDLWADVGRAGGTRSQVLDSPELKAIVLPTLRGDYRLSETYRPSAGPPLRCPVLACVATDDPDVDLAVVPTWGGLTVGGFAVREFPGGHFYLADARRQVIAEIVDRLPTRELWPSMP